MDQTGISVTALQEILACRVCLATTGKLFRLESDLKRAFSDVTGIQAMVGDGLPKYVCYVCCGLLWKADGFRKKCHSIQSLLLSLRQTQIKPHLIKQINLLYSQLLQRSEIVQVSVGAEFENSNKLQHNLSDNELDNNSNSVNHSDDELNSEDYFEDSEENEDDLIADIDQHHRADFQSKRPIYKDFTNPCQVKVIYDADVADKKVKQYILNDPSAEPYKKKPYKYIEDRYKKGTQTEEKPEETFAVNTIKIENVISNCEVKKFHDHLKDNHGYIDDKTVKKDTDICKKNRMQISLTKEQIEFNKKYNFDVVSFSKEEQIKNILEKKESDRYKNAIYKCEDCYIGFQHEEKYNNHRVYHDSAVSGSNECEVCKMKFRTKKRLNSHIYGSHRHRYICRECGQCFAKTTHCKNHYLAHSGATFQCQDCPASYKPALTHSETTIRKCIGPEERLSVTLRRLEGLRTHLRFCHGTEYCDICHTILTRRGLILHKKMQHKKTFKCQSCEKNFNDSNALEKHIQTSPNSVCNPNYWACSKCGDNFISESLYNEHIESYHRRGPGIVRRYLPRKPKTREQKERELNHSVMCEVCARLFPDMAKLKQHMRLHTGEKPFQCGLCPMRFHLKHRMQYHMRKHTGETPFVCSVCSKSFASLSNLQRHQSVHSKLRPYACHICHKTYPVAGTVKTHIRTVHMKIRRPPPISRKTRRTDENKREKVVAENKEVELDENEILDDDEGNVEEKAKDNDEEMPIEDSDNESETDCEEETVEDKREDSDIEGQTYGEQEIIDDCEVEERQVGLDRNEETDNEGVCSLEDWDEYREEIVVDQYDDDNDS